MTENASGGMSPMDRLLGWVTGFLGIGVGVKENVTMLLCASALLIFYRVIVETPKVLDAVVDLRSRWKARKLSGSPAPGDDDQ